MGTVDIRDYTVEYSLSTCRILLKSGVSRSKTSYASLPTYKEILQAAEEIEEYGVNKIELNDYEEIGTFAGCRQMVTAPEIPSDYKYCEMVSMKTTFLDCQSLTTSPILPNKLGNMWGIFKNCTNLTGDIIIPPSVSTFINSAFSGTTKPILLKGTKESVLAALAETSDRGNVTYQLQPPLPSIQCKVRPNDEIYPWDATSWCDGDVRVKVNDVWKTPRSIWIKHNNTWTEI